MISGEIEINKFAQIRWLEAKFGEDPLQTINYESNIYKKKQSQHDKIWVH